MGGISFGEIISKICIFLFFRTKKNMISIITSLYKSDTHLESYIKNIERVSLELSQANIEHEFILIFNDPDSNEIAKIEEIKTNSNIKSNVTVCRRESLYATWNRGIGIAKYQIITFWNVDDIRYTEALIRGISKLNEGFDVVYFPFIYKRYVKFLGFKILVKIKLINPPIFSKKIFLSQMHIGPFFITTKIAFKNAGMFDESFKVCGDFEWAVRAVKNGLRFDKLAKIAGIFTNDGTTLSGSKDLVRQDENQRIVDIIK